jgi:hypothetical protein
MSCRRAVPDALRRAHTDIGCDGVPCRAEGQGPRHKEEMLAVPLRWDNTECGSAPECGRTPCRTHRTPVRFRTRV